MMNDRNHQIAWILLFFIAILFVSCAHLETRPPIQTSSPRKTEAFFTPTQTATSVPLPLGLIILQPCDGQKDPCPDIISFIDSQGVTRQFQHTGSSFNLSHDHQKGSYIKDGDIWLLNFLSGKSENLTDTIDCNERDVTWSPDDTKLAYLGCGGETLADVYLLDLITGKRTNLSDTPDRYEVCFPSKNYPSSNCLFGWWSNQPFLVIAGSGKPREHQPGEVSRGHCHTFGGECYAFPTQISVNSKVYKILDDINGVEYQPALSPDGKILAYDGGILYNLETGEQATIYPSDYGLSIESSNAAGDPQLVSPVWSPDGKQIAWIGHVNGGDNGLFVFDVTRHEGYNFHTYSPYFVTLALPAWKRWSGAGVTWSPDSQWVTLSDTEYPQGSAFLWVFSRNGRIKKRFEKGNVDVGLPIWSPDSTKLVFIQQYFANSGIPQTVQMIEVGNWKVSQLNVSENSYPIAWSKP